MPVNHPSQQIPELFELLLRRYTKRDSGAAGDPSEPAVSELFNRLTTEPERHAASLAVDHFIEFCRHFLVTHPPQLVLTAIQGFGIELARVGPVRLLPATPDEGGGQMEPTQAVAVTPGSYSSRTQPVTSVGVTGRDAEP